MNVIGIDPSLSATGLCWGRTSYCTVRLTASNPRRLADLQGAVEGVLRTLAAGPHNTLAVIEDLPTHAHSAGLTGQAQGVVRAALQARSIPYLTVAPASLKKFATGSGRADKAAMLAAHEASLGWAAPKSVDDNQVDAWWLREVGYAYLRRFGYLQDEHFLPARTAKLANLGVTLERVP